MSVDTSRRYLEYLRLSYQVILVQSYFRNLTSSVVKTPKLYRLDVGILRRLSGRREESGGEVYETIVFSEIYKWIRTAQRNVEVYFYRTRSGLDLDLLLGLEGGRYLELEVKSRRTVVAKDTRALMAVADSLGKAWAGGIVVYQGDEIKKIADSSIWAVPSRRLFMPAGRGEQLHTGCPETYALGSSSCEKAEGLPFLRIVSISKCRSKT